MPKDLHIPHVSLDGKGEAASNLWVFRVRIRILQRTACQYRLLGVVESNGAELLPVRY